MKAGYVPDPFGHISQLPQILRGFGIDSFIFTRGMVEKGRELGTEFVWVAPDEESSVLAIHQAEGYCNASLLGYPVQWGDASQHKFDMGMALKQVTEQIEKLGPKSNSSYLLLNNGCDHIEAQPEIPDIVRYANRKLKNVKLVHGSFLDYVRYLKAENLKLGKYRGELRSPWRYAVLAGTLSSRMYLKQANDTVQTLLEKWVEPVSTFAWVAAKEDYPDRLIRQAWKYLIQNHPHDDICGCSTDQVHREDMHRFEQARQMGEALMEQALEGIAEKVDARVEEGVTPFIVFNALAWERCDLFEIELNLPLPAVKNFVIRDNSGKKIPYQIRGRRSVTNWVRDKFIDFECVSLALHDRIPPLGYKRYLLEEGKPVSFSSELRIGKRWVENSLINLQIKSDGTLKITEKKDSSVYESCLMFQDTEDGGDEYNYSPIVNTETHTSKGGRAKITLVEKGPILATYRIELDMVLPKSLAVDRKRRSGQKVSCPLTSFVTVYEKSPRIDVRTEFENKVKDHRLRVLFQADIKTDSSFAESSFSVEKRPITPPSGEELVEKVLTHPQKSYVFLNDGKRGIAIVNRGLPEYGIIQGKKGNTIAITLLRAVGWLSRGDLLTRSGGAGVEFPSPEAQCQGRYTFHYSIIPHSGRWGKAGIQRIAYEHNVPLKGKVISVKKGTLPSELSFLSIEPANLMVTCLKKAEDGNAVILRFFNTTAKKVRGRIRCLREIRKAVLTNLEEKPRGGLRRLEVTNGNEINLEVNGNKIVTVKLYLSR